MRGEQQVSIIANLHPCEVCGRRGKHVIVAPFITRPFFVCGYHVRAWAPSARYALRFP